MLIDWILELKDSIDRHGIRWGVVLTLLALFRKERRNQKLDKRDEAIFHNQKIIMNHLGVGEQWLGPVTMSAEDLQNLKKLYFLSRKGIQSVYLLRRERKMNQQINWITLIPALLGTIKLILQPLGIDLTSVTDEQVNAIANGVAALVAIVGVLISHRKGKDDAKHPTDSGAAV